MQVEQEAEIVQLIADFVIEERACGTILPYSDQQTIRSWVRSAANVDQLILAISDFVPQLYSRPGKKPRLKHLTAKLRREIG